MEKRVRVWVISPDAPDDKSVGWIDTSVWDEWVMRAYKDGEWSALKAIDDEEIQRQIADIIARFGNVLKYKGTVQSYQDLLVITDKQNGDVYNVINKYEDYPAGTNYAWSEADNAWYALGGSIDTSVFINKNSDLVTNIEDPNDNTIPTEGAVFRANQEIMLNIPTPDWGQNDSENKNYIKGRTHWKIAGDFVNAYIYNTSIEIQGFDVNANVFDIFRDVVPEFVKLYDSLIALHGIGKQPFLEVMFAQDSSNNDITQYINFESWGNSYEVLANSDENSHEITGLEFRIKDEFAYTDGDYTYIKLPEEYIPNTIARTSAVVFKKGRGSNSVQQKNTGATAIGNASVAEGWYTTSSGDYSHTEGQNNVTNNIAEHASGRFNKSTKTVSAYGNAGNTTLSHGIGTSDADRKNAFEIMENGDCYLYHIGNYNGNNYLSASTLQQIINNICVPMFVFGSIEPSGFIPDSGQPSHAEASAAYKSGRRVILVDTSQSIYEDVIQYNELVGGLKTIDLEWANI